MNYSSHIVEVVKSTTFDRWLRKLHDRRAAARVLVRIDYGPGYRVYYLNEAQRLIVLLCGGDKSTQDRDIATAHQLAAAWRNHEQDH